MLKYFRILVIIVLFVTFLIKIIPVMSINSRCVDYDNFLKISLNGVVIKKYIDSTQHSYHTIEIKNFENLKIERIILDLDTSDLFTNINVNDMVYKVINSDSVFRIKNNQKIFLSKVDFGCTR